MSNDASAQMTAPAPGPLSRTHLPPRVTVLSGGVGGARFLQGVLELVRRTGSDTEVTVVANTADDLWVHGLKVCPDLDTVMYTLGDGIDPERGWGRRDETWHAGEELAAYGVEPTWFGLGDRDIATHLVRTQMLDAGYPLSAVTA
ncbi:MAG: 2-phospho-L-lactate transferase, partial [Marmoricola sp.]|nr:2-phospho-L-lactate transferase [Marmoricola sp.]